MVSKTFVLGAGFSLQAGFPLVRNLRQQVLDFIQNNNHPSWAQQCEPGFHGYPEGPFYTAFKSVDPEGLLGFEELLFKLRERFLANNSKDPWFSNHRILRNACGRLLWEKHAALANMPTPYRNFGYWMYELHDLGLENAIISLNWDLVAERALKECSVAWSYTIDSSVSILKPHGSINWSNHLQKGLTSHFSGWQQISPNSPYCFIPQKPFFDPFDNGPGDNLRQMIFPGDPEDEQGVTQIWNEAAQAIRERSAVVFIAYSLPDYDKTTMDFFCQHAEDKPVEVYVRSIETLERYRKLFPNVITKEPMSFENCPYAQFPDEIPINPLLLKR